jgi:hypothetical protein
MNLRECGINIFDVFHHLIVDDHVECAGGEWNHVALHCENKSGQLVWNPGCASTIKRLATKRRDAGFPQQPYDMAGTAAKIQNLGHAGITADQPNREFGAILIIVHNSTLPIFSARALK